MSAFGLDRYSVIGHIGNVRVIDNVEKPFTAVSVAVDRSYTPKEGERVERTEWIEANIAGTGLVPNLLVGRNVLVEGTPKAEAYLDAEGKPAATLKVKRATITFLDKKPE